MEEIKMVEVDDIKMNYFKFGSGHKNLIIIPGVSVRSVMEFKDAIINQYKIFQNDFSIYVFDRRLNILSDYSIDQMSEDMIKVLERLELNDLYVIGVSQGGMIAEGIAIKRPDLVNKLVIGSSTISVDDNAYIVFNEWSNLAKEYDRENLAKSFMNYVYSEEYVNKYKDAILDMARTYTNEELDKFVIMVKSMFIYDASDLISNISAKTLIVCSKGDKIFDYNNSIRLNDRIYGSIIHIYDGYSHAVYDEAPDFNKKVYEFFMN